MHQSIGMQTEIGAYEAKTKLLQLLREVQAGKRFTITSSKPVVALGPPSVPFRVTGKRIHWAERSISERSSKKVASEVRAQRVGRVELAPEDASTGRDCATAVFDTLAVRARRPLFPVPWSLELASGFAKSENRNELSPARSQAFLVSIEAASILCDAATDAKAKRKLQPMSRLL